MLKPELWQHRPDPIFYWRNGQQEDFVVRRSPGQGHAYEAFFVAGAVLTDMRLHRAWGESPVGPFHDAEEVPGYGPLQAHTRLYSGQVDAKRRLITAVTPGLPRTGIWLFTDHSHGLVKRLLIPPLPETLFSISAGNPAVIRDEQGDYNVFFEGRDGTVFWRMFYACWDGAEKVDIRREPLFDGANPTLLFDGGTAYLYYSKLDPRGGFAQHVATQPIPTP